MRSPEEQLHLEDAMHAIAEHAKLVARVRRDAANDRAVVRCLARDDVLTAELREDGTILCTDHEGRQVLRPAGWRGRS